MAVFDARFGGKATLPLVPITDIGDSPHARPEKICEYLFMSNATANQTVEMVARVKVFGQIGNHRLRVDVPQEMVGVWDSIAGHYTTCHSISARVQRRIIQAARQQQEAARG